MNGAVNARTAHFFSQLVYLDTAPVAIKSGGKSVSVGDIADYYLNDRIGALYLKNRFGDIRREYGLWADLLQNTGLHAKWRASYIFDDNRPGQTGFYGCAYFSPSGEAVASFRGSELLGDKYYRGDYVSDLALSYMVPTPQQAKVDEFWSGFPPGTKGVTLTGHSLGGNLAVYAAVCAPERIRERLRSCAAFNAPGFCREFIVKHKTEIEIIKDTVTLYQNKFDPVSSMLEDITEPFIASSICDPGEIEGASVSDIFYPHSNFCYKIDGNGFVRDPKNEKSSFCRNIHTLTELFQRLPKKAREDIADIILKAVYAAPSPQKRLRFTLDAALKYISRGGNISLPGMFEWSTVAYAAALPTRNIEAAELYKLIADQNNVGTHALALTIKLLAG